MHNNMKKNIYRFCENYYLNYFIKKHNYIYDVFYYKSSRSSNNCAIPCKRYILSYKSYR